MARIKYYDTATSSWVYADAMGSTVIDAVLFTEQTLTEGQKAQARANIGVGSDFSQMTVESIGKKIIGSKIKSIVLMGDSITDGAGGTGYNGSYSGEPSTNTTGYCWANAFKKFVEARYDITVTNKGMYGTQMVTQKNKALEFITENDFVIWLTGTNDRDWYEVYQNNFLSYINAIKEKCAGILVISNIPSTEADENNHAVNMQKMDEVVIAATAGNVPHFSMYQEFTKYCDIHNIDIADCFADHVHPNDLGYFIMFYLMCQKLGLPLDPYTSYKSVGMWWGNPGNVITDSTPNYPVNSNAGIILAENITPCLLMDEYNDNTRTTIFSGKHITKLEMHVYTAGKITIGTTDLSNVGNAYPTWIKKKVFDVTESGFYDFWLDWEIGEHETLMVQDTNNDTGLLSFVVTGGNMFIWKSADAEAGESTADLILYGKAYAA